MASTSAFGWETPDDTDLVKDGAAAIRTLGNSIDTSMAELKGGTTGQVLSKTSNTDMDFTWVAQDDSNAIQNAIVDAKGDLIAATANDTPSRLAVGANNEMLVADSSTATGLDWKTATEQYPWTAYTPTLTNITLGNGTIVARYQQIGKTVNFEVLFTMGSTSVMGGPAQVSMPVSPARITKGFPVTLLDDSVRVYWGNADIFDNRFYLTATVTDGTYAYFNYVSGTVPFTWTTNDKFSIYGSYEAA
jgi:hypothetical protein